MKSKKRGFETLVLSVFICCAVTVSGAFAGSITIGPGITYIGKTVMVNPLPGDTPSANATALLDALNGITTASATEPYLLKLGPGIYDLGLHSLQMKPYVDIEGSGENATIIQGSIVSSSYVTSGVVSGADHTEIRFLTVKNVGPGEYAVAIYNISASLKMTNLTVTASGGTINYGVYSADSPLTMDNVTVTASGGYWSEAIFNDYNASLTMRNVKATASDASSYNMGVDNGDWSSLTMRNVTVTASGGTNNYGVSNIVGSTARIYHSVIQGTTNTIYNNEGGVLVGNTQLEGGPVSNTGTLVCVGAYNGTYAPLGTNCQ